MARHNLVVVIDDDLAILESLEQLLSSSGYQTELFESAEEFLSLAPTLEAACFIIDVQLGNISAWNWSALFARMVSHRQVIFITGSHDELHRQQAMELGCVAFLLKPFSAEQLIEPVRKAIGSKLN